MKQFVLKIVKYTVILFIAVCVLFALFLGYLTYTRFKPKVKEQAELVSKAILDTLDADSIRLVTWNIGYCGLGQEMDFFYEGGSMVRPDHSQYKRYSGGVLKTLSALGNPDFIFLQEVDRDSRRSYSSDQVELCSNVFKDYESDFAVNYKAAFVPIPLSEPMGNVLGGILTMSRFKSAEATRYSYPSSYGWPKQLFMLNRCLLFTRFNVKGGRQLVLINTHNSAFDDAAEMRKEELSLLKKTILAEYQKGNYVIAGGDWNQNPVPYDSTALNDGNLAKCIYPGIPAGFLPEGWKWAYDPLNATNRDVNAPYSHGKTRTTIIDFFVLSPNVKLKSVRTLETGFEFSDHQPVEMEVELK
jgi:endonuclease/exonuclease/phosphatase family metal-dependent hydrolase